MAISFWSFILAEGDRKIASRKIAPQQILPWVMVRVWVGVRMGGNLPGGDFPSTWLTCEIWYSQNTFFGCANGEIKYLQNLASAKISTLNPFVLGFLGLHNFSMGGGRF